MIEPKFRIIQGDGIRRSPWLDLPTAVLGRSPYRRDVEVSYRTSVSSTIKMDAVKRRQAIHDYWAVIIGRVPPVNNSFTLQGFPAASAMSRLFDARACFRGLKRPVGNDGNGWDSFAFISKPKWTVEHYPSLKCMIRWFEVPDDLVFATYVRLDQPENRRYDSHRKRGTPVSGVITHWEFLECDQNDNTLPVDYRERYRKRYW